MSAVAEAEGIRFGMAFKEAELRCPQGIYLPDDPEKYDGAFSEVLEVLDRFSPSVEDSGVGLAFMDAAGLQRLYGSDSGLCDRVQREIYESTGQTAWIGLAESKFAAEVAARTSCEGRINVIETDDRQYLAGQAVDLLPLPEKALAQLRLLGVDTMDGFAALPRNSVRLRYGTEGLLAWRLAQGDDRRPVEGRERALVLEDVVEFEWDEHNFDRITFALQALSERLATRLEARGMMAQRMRTEIGRSDGASKSFTLDLPEPSAQARTFRDAVRWYLEANEASHEQMSSLDEMSLDEPGVAFIRIEVEELVAFEGKPLGLFANRADQVERANRAMSRLRVELGDAAVFRTELCLEERLPERAFKRTDAYFEEVDVKGRQRLVRNPLPEGEGTRWGVPRKSQQSAEQEERYAAGSGGMLRLFGRPVEVRLVEGGSYVLMGGRGPDPLPEGEGTRGSPDPWLLAGGEGTRREVQGSAWRLEVGGISRKVVACRGPHRITSEWWEEPDDRDYFRVSLDDGVALLMYRDLKSRRWYVQGTID